MTGRKFMLPDGREFPDPDELVPFHQREPHRLFGSGEPVMHRFELVRNESEFGHATRVFARRVLLGKSPMLWYDIWVAEDREHADVIFDELVELQRQQSELLPARLITIEYAERAYRFEGSIDRNETMWTAFQSAYVVGKVSTFNVDRDRALKEPTWLALTIQLGTALWIMKHGRGRY